MLCILSWKLFWQVGRNILDYRSMLLKIIEIFSFLVSVDSILFVMWLAEPAWLCESWDTNYKMD